MNSFTYHIPTEIVFGADTHQRVGELVRRYGGTRVLVVYGGKSARESGLIDEIAVSLRSSGVAYEMLGGVQPNPRLSLIEEGIAKVSAFRADFILGVGGGSAIDSAKAIADGAANPGTPLWSIWTKKVPLEKALGVGMVLTIPASGSETSCSASITNEAENAKLGLDSPLHRPRFAVMNPRLTLTLPKHQIACGAVDILMHTLERYMNPVTDNELTDSIAEAVMRSAVNNGLRAYTSDEPDEHAMSELMWAGSLSHNDLTGLGGRKDFANHFLARELNALYDVTHGDSLSALWGSWARCCLGVNDERFVRLGHTVLDMVSCDAESVIERFEEFFRSLGLPVSIPELLGAPLREEQLEELALRCLPDRLGTIGSFRPFDYEAVLSIYRTANGAGEKRP